MTYRTASDFRRALEDRLTTQARAEQRVDPNRLRVNVAFERFLARLFHDDTKRWVLKGGYALELRYPGRARATRDLDLNVPPPLYPDLLDELQAAAERDLGDHFEYKVSAPASRGALAGPPEGGHRFSVEARLAGRRFATFPLDVGQGDVTIREPDHIQGRIDLTFAGIATPPLPRLPSGRSLRGETARVHRPARDPHPREGPGGHGPADRPGARAKPTSPREHRGDLRTVRKAPATTSPASATRRMAGNVPPARSRGRAVHYQPRRSARLRLRVLGGSPLAPTPIRVRPQALLRHNVNSSVNDSDRFKLEYTSVQNMRDPVERERPLPGTRGFRVMIARGLRNLPQARQQALPERLPVGRVLLEVGVAVQVPVDVQLRRVEGSRVNLEPPQRRHLETGLLVQLTNNFRRHGRQEQDIAPQALQARDGLLEKVLAPLVLPAVSLVKRWMRLFQSVQRK